MINEIFAWLATSPSGSRPMAFQRDDDKAPFSNTSSTPLLVRQQTGPADKDLTRRTFDLWLFTAANPANSDIGNLFAEAKALEEWIIANHRTGRIYAIDVVSGASGPYRDGQQRQSISMSITAHRNTGN
jgi:hypothetical protein